MKLNQCLCLLSAVASSSFSAFTTPLGRKSMPFSRCMTSSLGSTTDASSSSETDVESQTYDKIGFSKDQIAIGIDPEDVLQWLGTKDQLVTKFEEDNPQFDNARAEEEVIKFMMDGEMVNKYITFERRKKDPVLLRQQAEENLSDPSTWATYAIWIIGGAGFAIVKNLYIEPKYASGEWQDFHINIPNILPVNN